MIRGGGVSTIFVLPTILITGSINLLTIDLSGNYVNSHGSSASFSCLRLFLHLLVKIQNSFLCMC